MNELLIKLYLKFQALASHEEGQDLVEYALVIALVALGAVTGMGKLATGVSNAYSNLSSSLTSAI